MPWPNRVGDGAYEFGGTTPAAADQRARQGQRPARPGPLGAVDRRGARRPPGGAALRAAGADRLPVRRSTSKVDYRLGDDGLAVTLRRHQRRRASPRRTAPACTPTSPSAAASTMRADPAGHDGADGRARLPSRRSRSTARRTTSGAARRSATSSSTTRTAASPTARRRRWPIRTAARRRVTGPRGRRLAARLHGDTIPAAARGDRDRADVRVHPDAFRSGVDLIVLAPGETHRASFTIAASLEADEPDLRAGRRARGARPSGVRPRRRTA